PGHEAEKCENRTYSCSHRQQNQSWAGLVVHGHKNQMPHRNQPESPEKRANNDAPAKGPQQVHDSALMRYPNPRTGSMQEKPSFRRRRAINTSTVFESRSKPWE